MESPLDAVYWVATIDYRLLGFDAHKRAGVSKIPICLHPTTLLQMLQLWVPRSPELDRALFASLRPLVPSDFDIQAERVTVDIIRALSRYENVDDLSEESISSVLLDSALRARIAQEKDVQRKIELVTESLAEQNKTLRQELDDAQERRAGLQSELETQNAEIKDLSQKLHKAELEADELRSKLEVQAQGSIDLQKRTAVLEETERRRNVRRGRTGFFGLAMLALCLMIAVAWAESYLVETIARNRLLEKGSSIVVAVTVWMLLTDLAGRRFPHISSWSLFRHLQSLRKWTLGTLGAVVVSLLASYIFKLVSE